MRNFAMIFFTQMSPLLSPIYIVSLALLYLNDCYFKEIFSNGTTGKLSDVTGLFCFGVFWGALFPKLRLYTFTLIAGFFIFWKLSISDAPLKMWNSLGIIQLGRTKDITDLWALLVLPLAHIFLILSQKYISSKDSKYSYPIAVISCFVFLNTSFMVRHNYEKDQPLIPLQTIQKNCRGTECGIYPPVKSSSEGIAAYSIRFSSPKLPCSAFKSYNASMGVSIIEGITYVSLKEISVTNCSDASGEAKKALIYSEFERIVLKGEAP